MLLLTLLAALRVEERAEVPIEVSTVIVLVIGSAMSMSPVVGGGLKETAWMCSQVGWRFFAEV